ncbi:serine/threonine-protein kinase [Streptomyces sp. T-3]|nr:serine/threonine-protein kinase [Streptomyces sp. T-3]
MEPLITEDPTHIGPYRLIARLGAGGMGLVYLGRSDVGRTVAVKVVQGEYANNAEFRRRFAHEVAAARQVGGAWTAAVLDADTEAQVPWVATQYVAGPSLQTVVAQDFGPLPEASVRSLGNGLALALTDIHAAGLIHRDLKPQNVLVTVDGPRVIDFGIARALETLAEGAMTRTGAVIGSPGFMSPEQVRGQRLTPASDVFCLGSVLAYAATGNSPFGTADSGLHALMFRVAEEEPHLDGVPEPLLGLVQQCLQKDPAHRPTPQGIAARTATDSDEPWLPGKLLSQLGRTAAQLLDYTPGHPGPKPMAAPGPAPAPIPTPTATPTYRSPQQPAWQASTQAAAQAPPPAAAPFLHHAPTSTAFTPPPPTRPGRRRVVVAVSAVAAFAVVVGGLIALRPWSTSEDGGSSGGGGGETTKPNILPDGFAGTWNGTTWDRSGQVRFKITKGGRGDKVTEYSMRFAGHMCVYSSRLTSVSDANVPGSAAIETAAGTLDRAEPKDAAKDCAEQQPAMTLKSPLDGTFELMVSKADPVILTKEPLADPDTKLLEPFQGPWRAESDALNHYDEFDFTVFGRGKQGVAFRTKKDGKTCHYIAETFSLADNDGRETTLYAAPAQLRTDDNEGAPPESDPGCAKDGPLLETTSRDDGNDLRVTVYAPLTADTMEGAAELTKSTG